MQSHGIAGRGPAAVTSVAHSSPRKAGRARREKVIALGLVEIVAKVGQDR